MARLFLFLALLLVAHVASFSIPQRAVSIKQRLYMSDGDEPPVKSAAEFIPGAASPIETEASYPIPLPSPILLGGAMILGIASIGELFAVLMIYYRSTVAISTAAAVPYFLILTAQPCLSIPSGSIFELTGGTPPPLGVAPTLGIVAVGLPACLYLFYASILKAQAETEEDDKKFLGS
jgi:hypothetical protein